MTRFDLQANVQFNAAKAKAYWLHDRNHQAELLKRDIERIAGDYVRYVETHGFMACNESTDDTLIVSVHIPYTKRESDGSVTNGIECTKCHTFNDIRLALGY